MVVHTRRKLNGCDREVDKREKKNGMYERMSEAKGHRNILSPSGQAGTRKSLLGLEWASHRSSTIFVDVAGCYSTCPRKETVKSQHARVISGGIEGGGRGKI